jgi:hypothetical protein
MTRWATIAITLGDATVVFKTLEDGQVQVLQRAQEPSPLTGHIYDQVVGVVDGQHLVQLILEAARKGARP